MEMIMIDNFDSFTYNLVDEFEKRGCKVHVYRNNISIEELERIVKRTNPKLLLISPGPSSPKEAGISIEAIREYSGKMPIFGVCLGHQCIIEAFNGKVGRAIEVYHGKPSKITHDMKTIFKGLGNPMQAGRYHSLSGTEIPECLEVSSRTEKGIVMGVRHKECFVEGVQFHPESILTPEGSRIIENLIRMIK